MSGNRSNASNVLTGVPRKRKCARLASRLTTAFELYILAEIAYYYLSDGTQTLHGAVGEWCGRARDSLAYGAEVARTRIEIRKLPER